MNLNEVPLPPNEGKIPSYKHEVVRDDFEKGIERMRNPITKDQSNVFQIDAAELANVHNTINNLLDLIEVIIDNLDDVDRDIYTRNMGWIEKKT